MLIRFLLAAAFVFMASAFTSGAFARGGFGTGSNPSSHYTSGYVTRNGTIVAPHYQTNPTARLRITTVPAGILTPTPGKLANKSYTQIHG